MRRSVPMPRRAAPLLILFLLSATLPAVAQGITRSSGLGVRATYWNMNGTDLTINVTTTPERQVVDLNGVGAWLFYFSRFRGNLFTEFHLGGVSRIFVDSKTIVDESVDIDAVLPLLFGLRYDFFSFRLPSRIQPYLSGGVGSYWQSSIRVVQSLQDNSSSQTSTSSALNFGGYLGGGLNVPLTSWFGLQFDLKHHWVDFDRKNDISGLEFGMGAVLMWGRKKELFRIRGTRTVVEDIYPAYYRFYRTYPLALVSIENTAGIPIEVNLRAEIPGYSPYPLESGFIRLEEGETRDLPVRVMLESNVTRLTTRESVSLSVAIEGRAGSTISKTINTPLTLHTRNAWNGEMDKLGFFLTPEAEAVQNLSRAALSSLDTLEKAPSNLARAQVLFDTLRAMRLRYRSDPNIPFYRDDRVQYPAETLQLGGGDCDDLVVLYASLLESVGIATAFVQVRDPEAELAHLYLLFDAGVGPADGHRVSANPKRYVLRENGDGRAKIWIPVETTRVGEDFEQAWSAGALQYLEAGQLRNGLAEGWVTIIDMQ